MSGNKEGHCVCIKFYHVTIEYTSVEDLYTSLHCHHASYTETMWLKQLNVIYH